MKQIMYGCGVVYTRRLSPNVIFLGPNVWVRCCLHTLIFLGPIGLRLQLADPNGKQITSHSSIIRGAYWVKITAGKKTAAVLRRRRSRRLT